MVLTCFYVYFCTTCWQGPQPCPRHIFGTLKSMAVTGKSLSRMFAYKWHNALFNYICTVLNDISFFSLVTSLIQSREATVWMGCRGVRLITNVDIAHCLQWLSPFSLVAVTAPLGFKLYFDCHQMSVLYTDATFNYVSKYFPFFFIQKTLWKYERQKRNFGSVRAHYKLKYVTATK